MHNGSMYEGHFRDGKRWGYGRTITWNGCMHEGLYEDDQPVAYLLKEPVNDVEDSIDELENMSEKDRRVRLEK